MAILKNDQQLYLGRGPVDAKSLVKTYAELLSADTWVKNDMHVAYNGMIVAVWLNKDDTSKNGVYFLFDPQVTTALKKPDFANEANWHKLANVSDLAAISEKLPAIDELVVRAQNLEAIINGSEDYEGLTAAVAKNTAAIAAVTSMSTKIVDAIPLVDEAKLGVIYLVADEKASGNYIEYILVDDGEVKAIEQIGSTAINLDNYVTADELTTTLDSYAKASNVVTLSAFEEFKTSTDADILRVAEETAKKADVIALDSYYKISDADAKFVSTDALAALLNTKADKETTYTKSEVNDIQAVLITQVNTKADIATTYTKEEVNALLSEIEGGSTESAASVARDLAAYKSENDAAVLSLENRVGTAKVGDVPATGLFAKIDSTQTQVDTVADNVAKLITATDANTTKLAGISTTVAQAIEDAIQTIPALEVATNEKLGGIKTGSGDNTVTVDDTGVASVKSVNVNTLSQDDGDVLVLNGGNTSDVI